MARAPERSSWTSNMETQRGHRADRGQKRPLPANIFEDDEETQDPNQNIQRQPEAEVLNELRELKSIITKMNKRQSDMEKSLDDIKRQLGGKNFDLAKSSHAEKVNKILAKAYIQLGRFAKINESKTEQLQLEFRNSPYGLKVEDMLLMAKKHEKSKFTYWRAEERRRVLGIGNWSALQKATTQELASKICGLLGVKYNAVLEAAVLRQTALVKLYVAKNGRYECQKDDKFWINFISWKENQYGQRGPTEIQWDTIIQEE